MAIADRLLADLATQCREQAVALPQDAALSSSALEVLAHRCRITLRMEEGQAVVLGMADAVREGAAQLLRYFLDPATFEPMLRAEASEQVGASGGTGGLIVSEGADRSPMPRLSTDQPNRSSNADGRQHSQRSNGSSQTCCGASCPTCGASRFCKSCGALTGFNMGGQSHSWESLPTTAGSDRSHPRTPDALDTSPMTGGPQYHQQMPQQMMPGGMGQAMGMGQAGMMPVCMLPNGMSGAMMPNGQAAMPNGMMMVPASFLQNNGWMEQPDGSSGLWVPSQQ